jgi:hypothetical protein
MKKALLTTTALVALSGAAFASSVDTPVNSASSTHHTHSDATVVWSGDANIKYNVPLVKTTKTYTAPGVFTETTTKAEGTVKSDVDLDVTMTSPGVYSATISADISTGAAANLGANATITVTTPLFNVSVGKDDAVGGAGAGADASDLYADIDHMTGIGTDEDTSDWYIAMPNFGGWTIAASGEMDPNATSTSISQTDGSTITSKHSEMTSVGLKGSVGGLSITAGGMHKDAGVSVSTSLMGATVKVAAASIFNATKNKNVQEQGVQVDMPLGGMNLSVNSTTIDGTNNWGASVSTTMGGFAVSAGTDSDEDSQFKISGPMGPVTFVLDYDTNKANDNGTDAVDATIEAGVTYAVPGTTGTTISASYSNDTDEDNFDLGTQVKMAFKF